MASAENWAAVLGIHTESHGCPEPGCMTSLRWYFILQAESGHCEKAEGPEATQRPVTNTLKPFLLMSLAGSLIHSLCEARAGPREIYLFGPK